MDFRIVLIAFLGAVGIYFALNETAVDSGGAIARGDLNPILQVACAQEPEACDCIYPMLEVIGEDEELMSLVMEVGFSATRGGNAQAMAMQRLETISPQARNRMFEAISRIDLGELMSCMSRTSPAFRQMVQSPDLRAIREMGE